MITIIIPYVLCYATHLEQSQLLYQKPNEVVLPSNNSFTKRKSLYQKAFSKLIHLNGLQEFL